MPLLTQVMGDVAVEQGRIDTEEHGIRSVESTENSGLGRSRAALREEDQQEEVDSPEDSSGSPAESARPAPPERTSSSRRQTVSAARTSPSLPFKVLGLEKSRASVDPLGQLDDFSATASPSQSSPALPSMRRHRMGSNNSLDNIMQKYGMDAQMHLLRGHYCRSEVLFLITCGYSGHSYLDIIQIQFLLALENISNRLLVIPRPARVSALRAELTALNHKLPAEVCLSNCAY